MKRTAITALAAFLLVTVLISNSNASLQSTRSASGDSIVKQMPRPAKKALLRVLDSVQKNLKRAPREDAFGHLARYSEAAFTAVSCLAVCFDAKGIYEEDIQDELASFRKQLGNKDALIKDRLKNSLFGIYGLNAILYKIRFHEDTARINDLLKQHEVTLKCLKSDNSLFSFLHYLGNGAFNYLYATLYTLDSSKDFRSDLANNVFQYTHGEQVARNEDDRFLNDVYRLYELMRLWGVLQGGKTAEQFKDLQAEQKKRIDALDNPRMQIAVGMEYYYKAADYLSRALLKKSK
jgi:hypothetical protein